MMIRRPARPTPRQRAERSWRRLRSSPLNLGLGAGAILAVLIALGALRTVAVQTADATSPLSAHCGIGYYVFGVSNKAVDAACHHAYSGHALAFFTMLLVAAGLIAFLVVNIRRQSKATGRAPSEQSADSSPTELNLVSGSVRSEAVETDVRPASRTRPAADKAGRKPAAPRISKGSGASVTPRSNGAGKATPPGKGASQRSGSTTTTTAKPEPRVGATARGSAQPSTGARSKATPSRATKRS